jgi:hypothetical protein
MHDLWKKLKGDPNVWKGDPLENKPDITGVYPSPSMSVDKIHFDEWNMNSNMIPTKGVDWSFIEEDLKHSQKDKEYLDRIKKYQLMSQTISKSTTTTSPVSSTTSPVSSPPVVDKKSEIFSPQEIAEILTVKRAVSDHIINIKNYGKNHVIAGGCFVSYFHGVAPKDIDVFILNCREQDDINKWINGDLTDTKRFKFTDVNKYTKNPKIISCILDKKTDIQYIFTKYSTRKEIISNFDYVHCCTSLHMGELHIGRAIFDAIRDKKLIVNNDEYLQSYREQKFIDRGWKK